ncbi:MAG TPA: DinB family protein [Vicinamibacterales bacterium]|nr:DinB family protein [Vicinamibacterales bacterium]
MTITRPAPGEFAQFYAGYIGKVPDSGPVALLQEQIGVLEKLRALPDDQGDFRYADGKWSVKEVLGHVADAERVFSYRLTRIARGDKTPLAGFDENEWAKAAPHRRRRVADIVDELIAVRRATLALIDSLDQVTIDNVGVANSHPVSARAICWILAGHTAHHLGILSERYGVS